MASKSSAVGQAKVRKRSRRKRWIRIRGKGEEIEEEVVEEGELIENMNRFFRFLFYFSFLIIQFFIFCSFYFVSPNIIFILLHSSVWKQW